MTAVTLQQLHDTLLAGFTSLPDFVLDGSKLPSAVARAPTAHPALPGDPPRPGHRPALVHPVLHGPRLTRRQRVAVRSVRVAQVLLVGPAAPLTVQDRCPLTPSWLVPVMSGRHCCDPFTGRMSGRSPQERARLAELNGVVRSITHPALTSTDDLGAGTHVCVVEWMALYCRDAYPSLAATARSHVAYLNLGTGVVGSFTGPDEAHAIELDGAGVALPADQVDGASSVVLNHLLPKDGSEQSVPAGA